MTNEFTPTDEQQTCVDLAKLGESLAIEALAGAGKTSTLELIAQELPGHGQYMAFNKKIVTDAEERFPSTVKCSTAHSLAFQAIGKEYRGRMNSRRITNRDQALRLNLDVDTPFAVCDVEAAGESWSVEVDAIRAGTLAKQTVGKFCMSADQEIDVQHVPFVRGIDSPNKYTNYRQVAERIVPLARTMWAELQKPNGDRFRFEHSHYLKMWQLMDPVVFADYMLIDEAQDLNPLMRAIVEAQDGIQLIWVGDSQQQIYGWNGAVNALAEVDVVNRARLTESFRFGPEIAEVANVILGRLDTDARVTGAGKPGVVGPIESPNVILGRTNAGVVSRALYLMKSGKSVAVQGGTDEVVRFAEAAEHLMQGRSTFHPELSCFHNWGQVTAYVQEEDGGEDLKAMVTLVENFGPREIIDGLGMAVRNQYFADIVVSTAHKSKGAEWDTVELLGDFPEFDPADEELRLLYVAVTRAKLQLDPAAVDFAGEGRNMQSAIAALFDWCGDGTEDEDE